MLAGTVVLVAVTLPLAAGRDEAFDWSWIVDMAAWVVVVLLFPDGRLPGRRWRLAIWASLAGAGAAVRRAGAQRWAARGLAAGIVLLMPGSSPPSPRPCCATGAPSCASGSSSSGSPTPG